MPHVVESTYPIGFRKQDAQALGLAISHHSSVVLIGMKRVGISNFLRFFLWHPDIQKTYIRNGMTHVFIPVDLNDLIEREIFPFWTLILTRLVDATQKNRLPEEFKTTCRRLFRESIQIKDLFFTLDAIRKILIELTERDIYVTFFLIRFDRMSQAITPEFFGNLQGLREAANGQLSYIFTSFRPLHQLVPSVFPQVSLSVFSHDLYIAPAEEKDLRMILDTFQKRYTLKLSHDIAGWLFTLSGGHVQYLQLALIYLRNTDHLPKSYQELLELLTHNEEIVLQSEELFENLTHPEQEALLAIAQGAKNESFKKTCPYLFDTGMVNAGKIFCPLFAEYLMKLPVREPHEAEFTKKEHLLFSFLKDHEGEICERYDITAAVWPEQEELGVSDWAIDRLVARVRVKMKAQQSPYEIVTVITRGYKLAHRELLAK